ncbi:MAG: 2-phosphosulfolactate phosphatase [Tepidisphaerales bacterium]
MSSVPDARVILLPEGLSAADVTGRVVVVFDVLRATSTATSALAAGMSELRLYGSLDAARAGRRAAGRGVLLGEQHCLKPADFDYGNSPGQFAGRDEVRGATGHMATTNGTTAVRAVFETGRPARLLLGSVLNRAAVAHAVAVELGRGGQETARTGVTLLCAGTERRPSAEDVLGAGAVLEALVSAQVLGGWDDLSSLAMAGWRGCLDLGRGDAAAWAGVWGSRGARNLVAAGLGADIAEALRLDVVDVVAEAVRDGDDVVVRRWTTV